MKIEILNPTVTAFKTKLTKDDVFGTFDHETYTRTSDGMIVARGGETCPIFGDVVSYKSETLVCEANQEAEVVYWASYVKGGGCISNRKVLPDGRIALRVNYMCW